MGQCLHLLGPRGLSIDVETCFLGERPACRGVSGPARVSRTNLPPMVPEVGRCRAREAPVFDQGVPPALWTRGALILIGRPAGPWQDVERPPASVHQTAAPLQL